MDTLPKDLLFSLAMELDLPSLLRFCRSSKIVNEKVCKQDDIWKYKLNKEFPDYLNLKVKNKSFREIYTLLYNLNIVKQKLERKESIYELYNLQTLYLNNIQLEEIPKELGNLSNLRIIYLVNNRWHRYLKN